MLHLRNYVVIFTLQGEIIIWHGPSTAQLKFNFTLARKNMGAFTNFLHGITEYFSSNQLLLTILACARVHFLRGMYVCA